MGCPDWPRCFGGWYPPATVASLPSDYQEKFLEERIRKNARLAKVLSGIGMPRLARRVIEDPAIQEEEAFSPLKAWVEYINRVIGVIIGLAIIGTAVYSLSYWKSDRRIVGWSVFALVLVIFQGWVGSLVVSTNLLPGFVSFHMLLALLLVAVLIYALHLSRAQTVTVGKGIKLTSVVLLILFVPQIILGTQLRESIDVLMSQGIERSNWIANLDWKFYFHRSYSLLLLALGCFIYLRLRRLSMRKPMAEKLAFGILAIMLLETAGGAIMAYFGVPPFVQPLHLLMGCLLFGMLFYLILIGRMTASSPT